MEIHSFSTEKIQCKMTNQIATCTSIIDHFGDGTMVNVSTVTTLPQSDLPFAPVTVTAGSALASSTTTLATNVTATTPAATIYYMYSGAGSKVNLQAWRSWMGSVGLIMFGAMI